MDSTSSAVAVVTQSRDRGVATMSRARAEPN